MRLPKHTCPNIDSLIRGGHDFAKSLEDTLEKLREANSTLRSCAEEWLDDLEKAQKRIDELESELSALENKRDKAESRVDELEGQIADLKSYQEVTEALQALGVE